MRLLSWYRPWMGRLGMLALSIGVSLALGNGLVLAEDDYGGP